MNPGLGFRIWHEKMGEPSLENSKVSKVVL